MKERIRKLRRTLDLTQQEFADTIGMKRNTVANYETGRNAPSASVISLIESKFNVSREWLENGTGEMFIELTPDQELADFVGGLFSDDCEPKKKKFFRALAKLPDEFFIQMMKAFEDIEEENKKRVD